MPNEYPIDGTLDLHMFRPAEVKEVVLAYIDACEDKNIREIRIIHGKGIGTLRQQVHALLKNHPEVAHFQLAPANAGHWGATLVTLKP